MLASKPKRLYALPTFQAAWAWLAAQNYLAILAIIVLVAAIRLPIDYRRMMTITDNDYTIHIAYALDMLYHRPVPAFIWAHPLWHLFLIGVWWASRCKIDFWQSAIGLQALSSIASALIVYFWYGALHGRPSPWKRAFWAVTLVLVTPVILPALIDGAYYFGYIGLANYHNPTVHVLRPFALVMFLFALGALERPRHSAGWILLSALVVVGATLLKPNYTLILPPAVGIMAIYRIAKRQPLDWRLLIFGLGLPAALVLGWQYIATYINGSPDSKIAWMPLTVAQALSSYLGLKFLLSILFPLVIGLVFFRHARQSQSMILAWLGFGIGAAQFYLLADLPGLIHANFLWGAQISLFILFAATIHFLLQQEISFKRLSVRQMWLQYAAYLPHLLAGIAYYIYCFTTRHYG